MCCVCYEARIGCGLEPCLHVALCRRCADRIKLSASPVCPLCTCAIVHVHSVESDDENTDDADDAWHLLEALD